MLLGDEGEQGFAVEQVDLVVSRKLAGGVGVAGGAGKLAAAHVVGGHDAAQFADLVDAHGFVAAPVFALDDADRGAVRLVFGVEPDVHAAICAVALAAGDEAGLGEEGFYQGLEAAPFDDAEHLQAPGGGALGGFAGGGRGVGYGRGGGGGLGARRFGAGRLLQRGLGFGREFRLGRLGRRLGGFGQ